MKWNESDNVGTRNLTKIFDEWAGDYDRSIKSPGEFPFDGYEQVLGEIVRLATLRAPRLVLDLGTGTGNLAARIVAPGCSVWGVDFSAEMLAKARAKVSQARFVQVDLLSEWPDELDLRFDRIVSAYVFHHFALDVKIALLQRLAAQYMADGGYIVVGDIAFATAQAREEAHGRWADLWDEDEYYWAADETIVACASSGLCATFRQISSCGGVFTVELI